MKRPHMRLIACASVAGACICAGFLVEAAGPMGFVSRVWKERPVVLKSKESRLNPMNWFRGKDAKSEDTQAAAGESQKIERPELISDPFLAESRAPVSDIKVAKPYNPPTTVETTVASPGPQIVGSRQAVNHNKGLAETGISQASATPSAGASVSPSSGQNAFLPPGGQTSAAGGQAPRLPDLAGPGSSAPVVQQPVASAPPVARTEPRTPPAVSSENQFVGGFDAEFAKLVQSVVAETAQSPVQAPAPRLPESNTASNPTTNSAPAITGHSNQQDTALRLPEQPFVPLPRQPAASALTHTEAPPSPPANPGEFSTQNERTEFAQYASKLAGRSIDDIMESSRQRIATTPLANHRNAPREQLTAGRDVGGPQVRQIDSTARAPKSPSDLQMLNTPTMQITPGRAGSGVIIESPLSQPVRPRVTSNGAPSRSVRDNSAFEQLGYQTDKTLTAEPLADAADGPLLLLPHDEHGGEHFLDPAHDGEHAHAAAGSEVTATSAIDWPTEADVAPQEAGSGIGWVIAVVCLILLVAVAGFAARKKLQIDSIDLSRIRPRFEKD